MPARRFVRRSGGGGRPMRPSRVWMALSDTGWSQLASPVFATTAVSLLSLQAPTTSALTSDPPEDLTVLRIKGQFRVGLAASCTWTLALLVQDVTWTPTATLEDDLDKRLLWLRTFRNQATVTVQWDEGGAMVYDIGGSPTVAQAACCAVTEIDIAPKVRIECGKALYLVAYENEGTGSCFTDAHNMRLLFQRTRR